MTPSEVTNTVKNDSTQADHGVPLVPMYTLTAWFPFFQDCRPSFHDSSAMELWPVIVEMSRREKTLHYSNGHLRQPCSKHNTLVSTLHKIDNQEAA